VIPAPLALRADDATKVYCQTFAPLSTAFTIPVAAQNGETVTGVTETSAGSGPTASVAGSTYPIVITPGSATGTITASNYTITYVDGALTETPAPLTVRANDATKVFGATFTPASTAFTTTALQNGETVGSVTEVSPAGTPATAAAPGPYAITPSAATGGTFTPSNYTITYVDGALLVTPVPVPPIVVPPVVVIPPVAPPVAVVPPVDIVPPVVVVLPVVVVPPVVPPIVVVPPGTTPVETIPGVTPVVVAAVPTDEAPDVPQLELAPALPLQDRLNLTVVGTGVRMPAVLPPAPVSTGPRPPSGPTQRCPFGATQSTVRRSARPSRHRSHGRR
jgi:hypothetical protein